MDGVLTDNDGPEGGRLCLSEVVGSQASQRRSRPLLQHASGVGHARLVLLGRVRARDDRLDACGPTRSGLSRMVGRDG